MLWGVLLLVATGVGWVVIGAVIGGAARREVPVGAVQMLAGVGLIVTSLIVLAFRPDAECASWVKWMSASVLFASGAINYFVLLLMGRAMKTGPNGIVWATIQSALVVPFLVGVIFFGVALTPWRILGVVGIVAGLFCFGFSRDNRRSGLDKRWRWAMFGALVLAGLNQSLSNMPSYFPEAAAVSSVSRAMLVQLGTVTSYLVMSNRKLLEREFLNSFRNPWLYRLGLSLFAVSVGSGFFLMYRGLNAVAAAGAGAIGFPVIISSCIVGFTVYSRWMLKEKMSILQIAGLTACTLGIVCVSI